MCHVQLLVFLQTLLHKRQSHPVIPRLHCNTKDLSLYHVMRNGVFSVGNFLAVRSNHSGSVKTLVSFHAVIKRYRCTFTWDSSGNFLFHSPHTSLAQGPTYYCVVSSNLTQPKQPCMLCYRISVLSQVGHQWHKY